MALATKKNGGKYSKNKSRRHKNKTRTQKKKNKTFRKSVKKRRNKTVKGVGGLGKSSSSSSSDTAVVLELLTQLKNNIENDTNIHYDEVITEIVEKIDSMANTQADKSDNGKWSEVNAYIDTTPRGTSKHYENVSADDITTSTCNTEKKNIINKIQDVRSIVIPPSDIVKYAHLYKYKVSMDILVDNLKNLISQRTFYKCVTRQTSTFFRNIRATVKDVKQFLTNNLIYYINYLNKTRKAIPSCLTLKNLNYTISQMRDIGCTIADMTITGYKEKDLKEAGYTASEFWASSKYSVTQLHSIGFSLNDLKDAGVTLEKMKEAGYSDSQLTEAGYVVAGLAE